VEPFCSFATCVSRFPEEAEALDSRQVVSLDSLGPMLLLEESESVFSSSSATSFPSCHFDHDATPKKLFEETTREEAKGELEQDSSAISV